MEYSQRRALYPPQPANDSQTSRISIGALLNPPRHTSDSTSIPPTSPRHYQQHQHQHHHQNYSDLPYRQSHYHPAQNHTSNHQSIEGHTGYSDLHQTPRSSSAHSSPGLYPRERFPSVSSSSSAIVERRRAPRPKYDEEEMYFIWYHRVDLRQEWKEVRESFNAQFPNRQRKGFQGIQCKYYRFIKEKNCPTLREQRRRRSGGNGGGSGENGSENVSSGSDGNSRSDFNEDLPQYGVIKWTGVRFPWMREWHGSQ
ncbi:hypothetical protein RJZ56_004407 [Blastomyces dermatitidis]|uniref:Uncharacterized protein n=3 Tax=Blastomyces TaxID=229219 RepID=A0A179V4R6_BLAGS|nr:uncharacterized protein BDBG_09469 [Blastomyces gilchristii SLH14081]XP_031581440.1 hypothetical protein, variant [Blastomyces gilchristii SLH14081]XP_045271505.1 uncharacterized protein BDCG_00079 [Blastomyces dermatitidis ER-3]XP_045279009.1 hypothetical protein, variant [Blastomyces dermatitidis ER-3]EGE85392.2 hypothetical protein BDDG_08337 [Blastomyces dermatitidis ATCC 18188]EQL34006.1 hypothetical protein BDFG_03940 [Blastomyces dermatitidis ATCC 26199]EEQ83274.1 hypothetical prote